jgi:hypothetical protein
MTRHTRVLTVTRLACSGRTPPGTAGRPLAEPLEAAARNTHVGRTQVVQCSWPARSPPGSHRSCTTMRVIGAEDTKGFAAVRN